MAKSELGYIFALVGGILGLLFSLVGFGIGIFLASVTEMWFGALYMILAGYGIITAVLVIVFGRWMNTEKRCFKGALLVLIFSVLGAGTVFGLAGGIIGLVQSGGNK
jgi:ABC-type multidrug transport system permease subunit